MAPAKTIESKTEIVNVAGMGATLIDAQLVNLIKLCRCCRTMIKRTAKPAATGTYTIGS